PPLHVPLVRPPRGPHPRRRRRAGTSSRPERQSRAPLGVRLPHPLTWRSRTRPVPGTRTGPPRLRDRTFAAANRSVPVAQLLAWLHEAAVVRRDHGLDAVSDAELAQEIRDVRLDRRLAEDEP